MRNSFAALSIFLSIFAISIGAHAETDYPDLSKVDVGHRSEWYATEARLDIYDDGSATIQYSCSTIYIADWQINSMMLGQMTIDLVLIPPQPPENVMVMARVIEGPDGVERMQVIVNQRSQVFESQTPLPFFHCR